MFNYPVRLCVWYLCHYYWGKLPMKQKGLLTLWPVLSLPLWWRCWYTTATRRHDEVSSSALINRENPNTSIFSHLWGTKSSYLNVFGLRGVSNLCCYTCWVWKKTLEEFLCFTVKEGVVSTVLSALWTVRDSPWCNVLNGLTIVGCFSTKTDTKQSFHLNGPVNSFLRECLRKKPADFFGGFFISTHHL